MKLSVIIPYYNSEAWIGPLLEALLDQELSQEAYEIMVIDDGSTEEPVTLRRYAAEHAQLKVIRQENAGLSAARNQGIDLAQGDWVFFCDSDDLVRSKAIRRFIEIAETNGLDLLFWNVLRVYPGEIPTHPKSDFDALTPVQTGLDYMIHPPVDYSPGVWRYLVRRDLIVANGLRFQNLAYVEDSLFRLDLMPIAQRVAHVDVDFYYYVQRESSILHAQKRQQYDRFAGYKFQYLERLSREIAGTALPDEAKHVCRLWRDVDTFYLLKYLALYSPVALTKDYLPRLASINALPLDIKGSPLIRLTRRLMNHPTLWTLTCRLIHIMPATLRNNIN